MSAQEVIEQIKAMPPHERQAVVQFVQESEAKPAKPPEEERPNWRAIMTKIFDEHDELFRKLAQ
jgi:hypothetical protein